MDLRQLALLPVRVTVAATQTTLALGHFVSPQGPLLREGGYATQISKIIADDGLLNRLNRLLEDEHGPIGLAYTLAELTAEDRPIGKALARDGLLDRMASEEGPFIRLLEAGGPLDRALAEDGALYRFLEPGGPLDRLLAPGGPLERIVEHDGALDRVLAEGGPLDRILEEGGLLEQLLADQGILETLLKPGGTLDRLVELGETFEALVPRVDMLGAAIPTLNHAVSVLNSAVEPLSSLATRIPGARRRPTITPPAIAAPAQDAPEASDKS